MKRKITRLTLRNNSYLLGERTWLMGILNVTPDSFSDGGRFLSPERAIEHGLQMVEQGADIIDIGGESSRPGSNPVTAEEEVERILPVIKGLRKQTNCFLSVDTTKAYVAQQALDEGVDIINDISAGRFDPEILPLAKKYRATVILMHMKGQPKTMQINPVYENLLEEIGQFFSERISGAQKLGFDSSQLIIDPGIGFGKTFNHNLLLLNYLDYFQRFSAPLLVGVSRKSFIGEIVEQPPEKRLAGTIGACLAAIVRGTHILRVHDVQPIKEAIQVAEKIFNTHFSSPKENKHEKESYVH